MNHLEQDLRRALDHLEASWDRHLERLSALVRIPSVSTARPPDEQVRRSARAVADLLAEVGLERAEVVEPEGVHPYACAEWLPEREAPTVLLYAHHDVQPPGRPEKWRSPAFEPDLRDGRLFGRGAADDKAGVVMIAAALEAWLAATGRLPLGVRVLVEGEEEIGSEHLTDFLRDHRDRVQADAMILTDTANLDAGIPSLTVSLRGLVTVDVTVRALRAPLHSGMWGGPIPDPALALLRAIAELTDERGVPIEPLREGIEPPSPEERARLEAIPFDEARFRAQAGLVPGAELIGDPQVPPLARIWGEPSLSVLAFEAGSMDHGGNQIQDAARARVSLRVAPGQDPHRLLAALQEHFRTRVPWGLEVEVTPEAVAGPWRTVPSGPAFDAAVSALTEAYGARAVAIGCGGSIPFVGPFAEALGGVPAILIGVEDPECLAHSENESLLVEDWKKSTRALVRMLSGLAAALS